jgi:hypothetical protein
MKTPKQINTKAGSRKEKNPVTKREVVSATESTISQYAKTFKALALYDRKQGATR